MSEPDLKFLRAAADHETGQARILVDAVPLIEAKVQRAKTELDAAKASLTEAKSDADAANARAREAVAAAVAAGGDD